MNALITYNMVKHAAYDDQKERSTSGTGLAMTTGSVGIGALEGAAMGYTGSKYYTGQYGDTIQQRIDEDKINNFMQRTGNTRESSYKPLFSEHDTKMVFSDKNGNKTAVNLRGSLPGDKTPFVGRKNTDINRLIPNAAPKSSPYSGNREMLFGGPEKNNINMAALDFGKHNSGIQVNTTQGLGTLAHEYGHTTQGKMLRANVYGKQIMSNSLLPAVIGGAMSNKDGDVADNVGKGAALVGTAGGLATLGSELQASYRGAKFLDKGFKNKVRAYSGIPTYALVAAMPGVGYYVANKTKRYAQNKEDSAR